MTKETLKYTTKNGLKVFAKTFIKHKDSHVHEIKNFIISKQIDFYAVVNKDTLIIKAFDSESEAVNYVLDFYKWLNGKQTSLRDLLNTWK